MDAFEDIIAGLFRQKGYWTRQNYKIRLTVEEKRAVGKPSMPRPEIDILAYKPATNVLLWVECKSYLDSPGVRMSSFMGQDAIGSSLYKVFTNANYRQIAEKRLITQTLEEGLVLPGVSLQYALVAGRIYSGDNNLLHKHFELQGWLLFDSAWIKERLRELATLGYEDDVAVTVAKLFERTL